MADDNQQRTFYPGDHVVCRDGILDQWRFGMVTDNDGDHCLVHFPGDSRHPRQAEWVSADRLVPQSAISDVVEERPGGSSLASTVRRFFVDRFNKCRHGLKTKFGESSPGIERKRVRFHTRKKLKQTLLLSPDSCFTRTEDELKEMYRLQNERRKDRRDARKLMKNKGEPRTFFTSDYTKYIDADKDDDDDDDCDDDDVILPTSMSKWNNLLYNYDRDDDADDALVAIK